MSTELQRQVSAIKKQHVQTQSLKDGRASIFLTAKEAAGVDVSAVLEAAVTGLNVLAQYDSRFNEFLKNLLHESSIDLQRELKTKEENAVLDKDIERLLILLTPWAFEPNAHLVLEYLVRRYRVHEMNVDALLRAVIVAHDTVIFSKVVQLCKVSEGSWSFLSGAKDSSNGIPRSIIVKRVVKNPWILEALTERALSVLKTGGIRKVSKDNTNVGAMVLSGIGKFLSFFTAVVVEAAEQTFFDEIRLRHIYLYLSEGLKTHFNPSFNRHQTQTLFDWKMSCCLMITQLSKKTRFGAPLSKALSKSLAVALLDSKSQEADQTRSAVAHNIIITLCVLSQQSQLEMSPKLLHAVYKGREQNEEFSCWLFDAIAQMSDYDTSCFVGSIVWTTFKCLVREDKEDESAELNLSTSNLASYLCRFVQLGLLHDHVAKDLLGKIFSIAESDAFVDNEVTTEIRRLVKSFSNWSPVVFDAAIKSVLSSKGNTCNNLAAFLSGTFADGNMTTAESLGDDSLFITLCSPIRELRIQGLRKYAIRPLVNEENNTTESISLAEAVLRACCDTDVLIATQVWKPEVIIRVLSSISFSTVLSEVDNALDFWMGSNSPHGNRMVGQILQTIANKDIMTYFNDNASNDWLAMCIISALIGGHYGLFGEADVKDLQESAFLLLRECASSIAIFSQIEIKKNSNFHVDSFVKGVVNSLKKSPSAAAAAVTLQTMLSNASAGLLEINIRKEITILSTIIFVTELSKHKCVGIEDSFIQCLKLLATYVEFSGSSIATSAVKKVFMEGNVMFSEETLPLLSTHNVWNFTANQTCLAETKVKLAKALLSSHSVELIELVDICLEALFPTRCVEFLMQIVLNERDYLQIVGMSMLSAVVERKCSENNFDEILLSCSAICLWSCSHSDPIMRKWGLTICSHLSSLRTLPKVVLKIQTETKDVLSIDNQLVGTFFSFLSERAALIQLHADAVIALSKEKLNTKCECLIQYLWVTLTAVGWRFPSFSGSIVRVLEISSLNSCWKYIHAIVSTALGKQVNQDYLNELVSFLQGSFSSASKEIQREVVKFITLIVEQNDSDSQELKQAMLGVIAKGILQEAEFSEKSKLYELLMERQLSRPGDSATLDALVALNTLPQTPIKLIAAEVAKMAQLPIISNGSTDETQETLEGYSIPLQRMVALIEAAVPSILKCNTVSTSDLSSLLNYLFTALHVANRGDMKSILSIEYYKAVILEAISQALVTAGANMLDIISSSKTKSKSGTEYRAERVEGDMKVVMECLGSLKSVQIQGPAFIVLQALIKSKPSLAFDAIKEIGDLLSSPNTATLVAREKFLTGILELLLSLINLESLDSQASGSENCLLLQNVIQSLCLKLPHMSPTHRAPLLRTSLKILQKQEQASMLTVNVLLCHTLAAYENESGDFQKKVEQVEEVCLSRSAQRRAKRVVSANGPEEFYSLAKNLFLQWTSKDQISVLSKLIEASQALLGSLESIVLDQCESGLSVLSCTNYLDSLIDPALKMNSSKDLTSGYAATLAFLQMEFVLDIMDCKSFHNSQAKTWSSSSVQVQGLFLELADSVLKLIATSEAMRRSDGVNKSPPLRLRFESDSFKVSTKALLDMVLSWSLETLQSLQRLLDGPSFISIMQELFGHELLMVRQRAVIVLKDRLQKMLIEKTTAADECVLFFDLSAKMRSIIVQHLSEFSTSSSQSKASVKFVPAESALVQSAVMCLDVLIQFLGKADLWKKELLSIVSDLLEFIPAMYSSCSGSTFCSTAKSLDTKKLLASVLLCSSSALKMLNISALPVFSKLLEQLMFIMKTESSAWHNLNLETSQAITDLRAHVLFGRSAISSINMVITALPSFIHPHLSVILNIFLSSFSGFGLNRMKDLKGLSDDATTGLNIIATKIPPRLLVPALAQCIGGCLSGGHTSSLRMAQLVLQVSKSTDRATAVSNMSKWVSICFEMMEYRSKHGDFSTETDDVEEVICDSIVVLGLKFTEGELKAFVLRIVEWKSESLSTPDKFDSVGLRRSRTYYSLMKSLLEKLKFLFHPTMALLWNSLLQDLLSNKNNIVKLLDSVNGNNEMAKKRKRIEEVVSLDVNTVGMLQEMLGVSKILLSTIQILCETSSTMFINTARYDEIYPKVLGYLNLRNGFNDESEYLLFVQEHVALTLSRLCLTTARDSMWKPINHQVLLQMRHSHPSVRKASIRTLQHLFQEVGEEYLNLLPECLTFISELLEDDNLEVVACTKDAIATIEELSGESLDPYLKQQ